MTTSISPETARRVLALFARESGDGIDAQTAWSRAAYECELTLTSIAPYTDRATARVHQVCRIMERNADRREKNLATLQQIAAKAQEVQS